MLTAAIAPNGRLIFLPASAGVATTLIAAWRGGGGQKNTTTPGDSGSQTQSLHIGGLMAWGTVTPEIEKMIDDADTTGRDAAEKLAAEIVAKNADESEESDSSIYDLIQTLTDRLNSLASASPESSLAMVAGDAIEALKTLSWELQDHEIKG